MLTLQNKKIPLCAHRAVFVFNSSLFGIITVPRDLPQKIIGLNIRHDPSGQIRNVFVDAFEKRDEHNSFVSTELYLTFIGKMITEKSFEDFEDALAIVDHNVLVIDGEEVHLAMSIDMVSSKPVLSLIPRLSESSIDLYRFVFRSCS